jgi:biopolymer transport protein ExbB
VVIFWQGGFANMEWMVNAVGLLVKGGYVMIPLMLCSLVSATVLFERYVKISRAQIDVSDVIRRAEDSLYNHRLGQAVELLEALDSPVARVLAAGIHCSHLGERGAERAMEEQGTRETRALTHRLGSLDTIITIAPLLGLLGR